VDAGDHQTELLKSLELYYFGRLPFKKPFIALEIEIRALPGNVALPYKAEELLDFLGKRFPIERRYSHVA
jgi:hypothetical protein